MVGCDLGDRLVRPLGDQPVGGGDALRGEERRARVGDDRRPAEELRPTRQRLCGVDRAVDEQPRRRAVPLREDFRAVLFEQPVPAAPDELVELAGRPGRHPVAERLCALHQERLRADAVPLDDREEHRPPALVAEPGEALQQRHSTGSTKTSISPPHGSPTSQAISSVMP